MNEGLLTGVEVLDLTQVLAGPYCGIMLADMGAEAIEIGMPSRGDDIRKNTPVISEESAYFMNPNRNKRDMTLNLRPKEGCRIFKEMTAKSNIMLKNYRPDVMEKPGLGYEGLCRINSAIVYDAVPDFGHYRPCSQRAGYDIIGQAMSGPMNTTGWPEGQSTRTGTAISDVMGGTNCCTGVLAAYVNRLKTREEDKVDVSLVGSMISLLEIINMVYLYTGKIPDRIGNRYGTIYSYDTSEASDGMVIAACDNDKLYGLFKGVLQIPGPEGEEFGNNVKRVKNHAKLKPIIEARTVRKMIGDVVEILLTTEILANPVNTVDKAVKDSHIAGAREMFVEPEHPVAGKMRAIDNQLEFISNKIAIDTPAPLLGQHTKKILKKFLRANHEEYEELTEERVFQPETEKSA